jgi:hypothetical protein
MNIQLGDSFLIEDVEYTVAGYNEDSESYILEDAEGDQYEIEAEQLEEADTEAAKSIQGNGGPKEGNNEWLSFFELAMQRYNPPTDEKQNQKSIETKLPPVAKEEIEALFGSEEISEEFKEKTATLFESAVNSRVKTIVEGLTEEYDQYVEGFLEHMSESLVEEMDKYLSYAAQEWLEENAVEVENSLKQEFSESLLNDLFEVFSQHNIKLPEADLDVVDALTEKVKSQQETMDEQESLIVDMSDILEEYNRAEVVSDLSEGLTLKQKEKFRELAETVDFTGDEDDFKDKLETLKEHHFQGGSVDAGKYLFEEYEDDEKEDEPVDEVKFRNPSVSRYADAITRTTKIV